MALVVVCTLMVCYPSYPYKCSIVHVGYWYDVLAFSITFWVSHCDANVIFQYWVHTNITLFEFGLHIGNTWKLTQLYKYNLFIYTFTHKYSIVDLSYYSMMSLPLLDTYVNTLHNNIKNNYWHFNVICFTIELLDTTTHMKSWWVSTYLCHHRVISLEMVLIYWQ